MLTHAGRGFRRSVQVAAPSRFLSSRIEKLNATNKELMQSSETDIQATVRGMIRSIRTSKNITFVDLADGSCAETLKVVIKSPSKDLEKFHFKVGQTVKATGQWLESKRAQASELVVIESPDQALAVVGDVPESYPLQKKESSLQFLRGLPTLRHRTSTLASILRFRSRTEMMLAQVFDDFQFTKVAPPVITSADCEGAGEQFTVVAKPGGSEEVTSAEESQPASDQKAPDHFFGKPVSMTVSSQLHLEVLASSLNRVWSLGPCFRAENSNTSRHLSEFWMLEAEINHVEHLSQLVHFTEDLLRHLVHKLRALDAGATGGMDDLIRSQYVTNSPIPQIWDSLTGPQRWPCIQYAEALAILNNVKNKDVAAKMKWGDSISTEDEKWLSGVHFQSPVFVTDYPIEQKPFYMPISSKDSESVTVACFDLLMPGIGELAGGSLREHRMEELVGEMKRRKMDTESMDWYLSTRENGSAPHGGFGMGFERLLAFLSNLENVKDISAFPRSPNNCPC